MNIPSHYASADDPAGRDRRWLEAQWDLGRLRAGVGLVCGLDKFSGSKVRQRGSSPKLVVLNSALMTATAGLAPSAARRDPTFWARLTETAVGAHLVNACAGTDIAASYWRERNHEVDFVLQRRGTVTAIEVTSGRRRDTLPGMDAFAKEFAPKRKLLVGGQGIPLEEFLVTPPEGWLR